MEWESRWIIAADGVYCGNCGRHTSVRYALGLKYCEYIMLQPEVRAKPRFRYCPFCGAHMIKEAVLKGES